MEQEEEAGKVCGVSSLVLLGLSRCVEGGTLVHAPKPQPRVYTQMLTRGCKFRHF